MSEMAVPEKHKEKFDVSSDGSSSLATSSRQFNEGPSLETSNFIFFRYIKLHSNQRKLCIYTVRLYLEKNINAKYGSLTSVLCSLYLFINLCYLLSK